MCPGNFEKPVRKNNMRIPNINLVLVSRHDAVAGTSAKQSPHTLQASPILSKLVCRGALLLSFQNPLRWIVRALLLLSLVEAVPALVLQPELCPAQRKVGLGNIRFLIVQQPLQRRTRHVEPALARVPRPALPFSSCDSSSASMKGYIGIMENTMETTGPSESLWLQTTSAVSIAFPLHSAAIASKARHWRVLKSAS